MSKKDQLGRGSSFGHAAHVRSDRRDIIDQTIHGGPDSVTAITDLPVPLISDNPDNPRNHLRNLDDTVETVRELGILLPIVVATTDAYLRDRADRADDIDAGAQYIVVDGHRRLEAARRVGLATIPVRVDNARVATDETLLEAAFVANYHRDDMTDLEEAHALQSLVDYYGSQTKAAKRLGIPQGTISTKLSLLKLTPELQKDLVTGERTVEHVRNLGKLSPEEQRARADERAQAAKTRAERKQPAPAPADFQEQAPPAGEAQLSRRDNSRPGDLGRDGREVAPPAETIPEPRADGEPTAGQPVGEQAEKPPRQLPYDDGPFVALHLALKMDDEPYFLMLRVLLEKGQEKDPSALAQVLARVTANAG